MHGESEGKVRLTLMRVELLQMICCEGRASLTTLLFANNDDLQVQRRDDFK